MVSYQLPLKVEGKYIIETLFTDDELPSFTEISKEITMTNVN